MLFNKFKLFVSNLLKLLKLIGVNNTWPKTIAHEINTRSALHASATHYMKWIHFGTVFLLINTQSWVSYTLEK